MDKLTVVWDHVQAVFWFWFVWKVLDLAWSFFKADERLKKIQEAAASKSHVSQQGS